MFHLVGKKLVMPSCLQDLLGFLSKLCAAHTSMGLNKIWDGEVKKNFNVEESKFLDFSIQFVEVPSSKKLIFFHYCILFTSVHNHTH